MPRISHPRFIVFLTLFVAVTGALWRLLPWANAVSAGFDLAATVYVGWMFWIMSRSDADDIRRQAQANDSGRGALLGIAVTITLVILVTVAVELRPAGHANAWQIALPVCTLIVAWVFGNVVYTLHYAHLFYDDMPGGADRGGLGFPHTQEPRYWDFAYFSFNLGMCYQVSDVTVNKTLLRRVVMFHAIIAFFFNIGVLALALNIVAGVLGSAA